VLSVFFIIAQLTGAYIANSISIYTDAVHMATDLVGFFVSMLALKLSLKPATEHLTFGWNRADVLGTLTSVVCLVVATLWLAVEATKRILHPEELNPPVMLLTATVGLLFNIVQIYILHQNDGHYSLQAEQPPSAQSQNKSQDLNLSALSNCKLPRRSSSVFIHSVPEIIADETAPKTPPRRPARNMNLDAAQLHVLADFLMSIGVVLAALIVYVKPTWVVVDPLCVFFFAIVVCYTATDILKECFSVLMEGCPKDIDAIELAKQLRSLPGVVSVHDFHIWALSPGKPQLSCHVVVDQRPMELLAEATALCQEQFGIDHVTIQVEQVGPEQKTFKCSQHTHQELKF
jgi:zinc transporter 2